MIQIFQDPVRTTTLRHATRNAQRAQGLDVTNSSPSNAWGEVFFLDIPFYRTRPTEAHFKKGEIWRPGWGSFQESTPPAANRNYWASANGAISTYEDSSFRAHAAYCNSDTSRPQV